MKPKHEEVFTGTNEEINQKMLEIYQRLKKSVEKKKILFLVDNHNWCWTQTAKNIAANLPHYSFTIVSAKEFSRDFDNLVNSCDAVYMRGYPYIYLRGKPRIPRPFIYTIATGGENLEKQITQCMDYADRGYGCITQNEKTKIELERLEFKNVHVIPNGIDTELFTPSGCEKKYVVGFAGNNAGYRAELKGTGFVKAACEKLGIAYTETTLENRLPYEKMPDFYNSIQIYAQPSDSEGCSNSVMEAMSCGVPCLIVEGVGYHGQTCQYMYNAVFVKRDAGDIADKIKYLIDNPTVYKSISENARKFAEEHSWRIIAPRHGEVIKQALDSAPPVTSPANPAPVITETGQSVPGQKPKDTQEICCLCKFFFPVREIRDCGLYIRMPESMILKFRAMTCINFINKEN